MAKTKSTEIIPEHELNRATGTLAPTATPDASPPRELRGVDGKPLRALSFRDEQDADGYHNLTAIRGGNVATREMSDEKYAELMELQSVFKSIAEEAASIDAGNGDEKARAAAMDKINAIKKRNQVFTRQLIEESVAGWDLARPYCPSAFPRVLIGADQNSVLQSIIAASSIGREDSDFLAPNSAHS